MASTTRITLAVVLLGTLFIFSSCKGKSIFAKKKPKSAVTGWEYNVPDGFQVSSAIDQATGPGLVFVEGGTYAMGQTTDDMIGDWNNIPRRASIPSFYIDRTEVANVHYREYLFWLSRVFDPSDNPEYKKILDAALPDTLVWRSELSYNEPSVELYFRHPSFNMYPVVGVSWKQAKDFCLWRTDRYNEATLVKKGFIDKDNMKLGSGGQEGQNNFNTRSYLMGLYTPQLEGKAMSPKKDGSSPARPSMESGIVSPDYRLPFEAEWEYAAYGFIKQNPRPGLKEGKRGEEIHMNKQTYPWPKVGSFEGTREPRTGSLKGQFYANFKRGSGDNAGPAGGLNDRAFYTAPVDAFYPNGNGLYNMAGNVSEWVEDAYRPLSSLDYDDQPAPFRGNVFLKFFVLNPDETDPKERYQLDSMGRPKTELAEPNNRRNYQNANAIDYLDGDTLSGAAYQYGITTLIDPQRSKVYKGGSWNDLAHWLSPGSRRHLEEDQASATIGFRCAMNRVGSPEMGPKRRTGMFYPTRRQKR